MTDRWAMVATLADRTRRALFDYVRRQDHPVSREEAADAQRLSRGLAAFHLDKLVEVGLLRARFEAPADQPRGRGRTPKVYDYAGDGLSVTIPERRYELIAGILADAIATDPAHADEAALRQARRHGRELGGQLSTRDIPLLAALIGLGFEPEPAGGLVLLHNCPFHALAQRHTALVCGINHAFVTGLAESLSPGGVRVHLQARPGACCVHLTA